MRVLVAAASVALAASCAYSECVVVELEGHPSKPNASLVITRDGKAAEHLALDVKILDGRGESKLQQVTDRHGVIHFKKLAAGTNYIYLSTPADVKPKSTAEIRLDVTEGASTGSDIPLVLTLAPVEPTLDELAAAQASAPIEFTAGKFTGRIVDVAGAEISGAQITVYRRSSDVTAKLVKVQADEAGKFGADLEPGTYTVAIISPGFQPRFAGVEIKRDAREERMSIELKIASGC